MIEQARAARRPTLLVVDDVDHAPGEVAAELERVAVARPPAARARDRAATAPGATMTLGPLAARRRRGDRARVRRRPPLERLRRGERGRARSACTGAARRWARERGRAPARRQRRPRRRRARAAAGGRGRPRRRRRRAAGGARARRAARRRRVACPFKGLASFDVDDADVFFGRERLVAEMVARLAGAPLLGIVGPSGSGKSSALQAPACCPRSPTACSPAATAGRSRSCAPAPTRSPRSSRRSPARRRDGRLVIAVDQFEELFTACRDEAERAAFADALVAAVRDPRRRALVLIALRADFYGRCASYPELWRMLGANHVPVGPMRRDELRRAIESPAQRAGLRVDAALVDALVADVAGRARARCRCSRPRCSSCGRSATARASRFAAYDRAGGVHGAVARLAERVYDGLEPRAAGRARGRSSCGWRASARATPSCAGGVPLAELERTPGAADVLAAARRRAARDRQPRGGRGRARGAAARVAAAARLARGGRRGPPPAPPPRRRGARVGRARPRPRRALPRRAARRRARLVGRPRPGARRRRARVPRREPRGERALAAPPARRARRRRRAARARGRRGPRRARAARQRARPGDRRRRPAARLARARRERPRPLAAARAPGRRARRQPADARQPARRADQEPGRRSASCAAPASASRRWR